MRDTRVTVEVYHRRKVYRIHVEQTGEKVNRPYRIKPKDIRVPTSMLNTIPCSYCSSLTINSVCANKNCPSNITA